MTAYDVDQAVKKLLIEAAARAIERIERHRPRLERPIAALEAHESLDAAQIRRCLEADDGVEDRERAPPAAATG